MDPFAHASLRRGQHEMMAAVKEALQAKEKILIQAPTGIGKTAAVLAPALPFIKEQGLTIFFLTSRHTQHEIVMETLRKMRERHGIQINAASVIGKRWLCGQKGAETLHNRDFLEYCHALREDNKCSFYLKASKKKDPTPEAQALLERLRCKLLSMADIKEQALACDCCPYEIATFLARNAEVIISDYYYLFNEDIRNSFFARAQKELGKAVIIVDEAHNLALRLRELLSSRLTVGMLARAKKEAERFRESEALQVITSVDDSMQAMSEGLGQERYAEQHELSATDEDITLLEEAADRVRVRQQQSSIGGVASFLQDWQGPDEGYCRVLSQGLQLMLSYRCLDAAPAAQAVFDGCHAAVLMSGTLAPQEMHADLLGIKGKSVTLSSPFPFANRLNLIVPLATTKFSERNESQYRTIGEVCSNIIAAVPGNVLLFFPSYGVLRSVLPFLKAEKPVFVEQQDRAEREQLLAAFSSRDAVLAAVSSGSFGEGIDLKDNVVKAVVVVGLPLPQPDLEIKALIAHYDLKFGKGWSYGYVLPAMIKAIQNSGRCIRSETDRGAIIFLDRRYTAPSYFCCFPPDWQLRISRDYIKEINSFFLKMP
ncbi:MAG: ATP-dependent DNA helicase [Nanoarchaeota archaeon]